MSGAIWSDVINIFIIVVDRCRDRWTGPLHSAREGAKALEPVVGRATPALFGIGLLGASLLAASVVPLSTSYAIADASGAPGRCQPVFTKHRCSTASSRFRSWSVLG